MRFGNVSKINIAFQRWGININAAKIKNSSYNSLVNRYSVCFYIGEDFFLDSQNAVINIYLAMAYFIIGIMPLQKQEDKNEELD